MQVTRLNSLEKLNTIASLLAKYISPAQLAALGVLVITSIALFVPPYVGMADNGDYFRVLYSNGLYFMQPDYDSQYLGYFIKEFGIFQYFNENGATLTSSQSLFIRISVWINKLFNGEVFDIRTQAVLFTILYTIAVYLLVESLTWKVKKKYGYPIAMIAVFIFADTAYTAFFNSFYSESIVQIMLMFVLASGLLLYRNKYNDYVLLTIFFISGFLLTTSKQQNAPVGIIIALLGISLIFIRIDKTYRSLMALSLVGLMCAGIGTYLLIPQEFININKYHAMTRGVLMQSEDPEVTLEKFAIDHQFAVLNESIYYEPYTTVDVDSKILLDHFYHHYSFGSILLHYILHPDQAIKLLDLAAKDGFTIRPPAMGNFERSVDAEFGAQTRFFAGYSGLKRSMAPKTFGFIVIWIIVVIGLYISDFVKSLRNGDKRGMVRLPLIVMMMLMGLSGIAVSIIGAGDADLSKHVFLFTTCFDMVTFVVVADAIRRCLWQGEQVPNTIHLEGSDNVTMGVSN